MVLTVKMRYSKYSYTRQEQMKNEESEEIMDDNLHTLDDLSDIEKKIILEIRKGNKELEEFIRSL